MCTIGYGPNNSVTRDLRHTDEISDDIIAFLGGSPENVEKTLNGVPYTGPLSDGDHVELRQKANSKMR